MTHPPDTHTPRPTVAATDRPTPANRPMPGAGAASTPLRLPPATPGSGQLPSADMDTADLQGQLQPAYNFGAWQRWERAVRGKSNVTYFVDTERAGRVVLRRSHRQKTVPSARFEAMLLDHLVETGYPAPPVLRTAAGEPLVEIDGVVHMAFGLLPGTDYDPYNDEHLRDAARGLAGFHQVTAGMPLQDAPATSEALSSLGAAGLERLAAIRPLCDRFLDQDGCRRLEEATAHLVDELTSLQTALAGPRSDLSMGLLHASYGRSALLFTGDRLSGVVDYDRTSYDVVTLDLAYSLKAFCREGAATGGSRVGMDAARCRTFLQAYDEVKPLAAADREALPKVFRAQRLIKVLKKCNNVLTKQSVVEQESKDVHKLMAVLDKEIARLAWLRVHSTELSDALAA